MLDAPTLATIFTHADLLKIEASLKARGIPIYELCKRASIASTTWGRWKGGKFLPSHRAWISVTAAYTGILDEVCGDIPDATPGVTGVDVVDDGGHA